MADMRPPPPRYRIVEHKGRLIATDTWAEGRPTRSETPPPQLTGLPRISGSPKPAMPSARPEPASGGVDALGTALVLAICGGSVDPAGRPILSTRRYFDINGPREIVLSPTDTQRLGQRLAAAIAVAIITITLLWAFPESFIVVAILFFFSANSARTRALPAITQWLDRAAGHEGG